MIRTARPADANPIAGLQLRAWARAYADFLPPETLEADAVAARHATWASHLAAGPADRPTTLVWDQDGVVAGFASVAPARDEDASATSGELLALYVDPVAQGAGVGRALLAAATALLRDDGFADAVLWVFTVNGLARGLYERRGWTLDTEDVGLQNASEWWAPAVRYRLAL